jgi:hypothetical protein
MTEKLDATKLLEGTTPGPWHGDGRMENGLLVYAELGGYEICHVPDEGKTDTANASLIAAAPDLARENIELREAMGRMRYAGGALLRMADNHARDIAEPLFLEEREELRAALKLSEEM